MIQTSWRKKTAILNDTTTLTDANVMFNDTNYNTG